MSQKHLQNNGNSISVASVVHRKGGERFSTSEGYFFDPYCKIEFCAINLSDFQKEVFLIIPFSVNSHSFLDYIE